MVFLFTGLLAIIPLILSLAQGAKAAVIEHDFDVAWIWANPDGAFARPVIGINGQFPPPQINATVGDTVILNVQNSLGNQSTSLHFHGLFMNGSSFMDGTTFVSQCAIQPGSKFNYKFTIDQPGTYWYHSHAKAQYPDGLRGLIIVKDPESPYKAQYNEEISLSISDWYHKSVSELLVVFDKDGQDPIPDSNLINDARDNKIRVQHGKTYMVRLANIGAFVSQYFWIEGHSMKVVEVDGVYTEPFETEMLYVAVGQRYSFLLTVKNPGTSYAMRARVDKTAYAIGFGKDPDIETQGWFVPHDQEPGPLPISNSTRELKIFEDTALVPLDREKLFEPVGQTINIAIQMGHKMPGGMVWRFNTLSYEPPELPSIFTAISSGANATDPNTYGKKTQPLVLDHNKVVEISIHNTHMVDHPIHLHGHNFQVLGRAVKDSSQNHTEIPMRRDVMIVRGSETLKIRFRADNPGVWLLHCHMEWHAHSGMMATIVEAPLALQQQPVISKLQSSQGIHGACPGEQLIFGADGPSTSRSPWQFMSLLGLGAALVAVVAYFAHRYRARQAKNQAYSLVPLGDAEERRKEDDAGSMTS